MIPYKRINNLLGWTVFAVASVVYILTSEPTTSFWDCGEYIATAFKLQVGHPPGAPLFQLIGRFFSLFAMGDVSEVARMINIMSALASGFTILFLFWSVTMLARKLVAKNGEMSTGGMLTIFGSGLIGALAYTFSDSFWFSAVEGEVYGMSSFFTAFVFWAILKWEEVADEKHSYRWLILIAFMMGLSIGVHLLNLLAIPAITLVYYFRKYDRISVKGILLALIISLIILAFIQNGIIPWIVWLAGNIELLFVNGFGLPFNSGTVFYFLALGAGLSYGLYITQKRQKAVANTILLAFTFILVGYSSFFLLIIRSNANTPINENSPKDAISLLAYLNREQYGDWPILKGNYYNAPVVDHRNGTPVYGKDKEKGRYVVIDDRKNSIPVYDPRFTTIFPRMWSNTESQHEAEYKKWADVRGIPITVEGYDEGQNPLYKPTFAENFRFFWRYQLNHMYWRYFMWNFAGRQNDVQGYSDRKDGNWVSGLKFLDEARLGPQDNIPDSLRSKAHNRFYLLPLLLGLMGLVYQVRVDYKNSLVVLLMFFMTGIAIVFYLNQYSPQPRERDYAYAASFYAFAIWIGLGIIPLCRLFTRYLAEKYAALAATLLAFLLVPVIMAKEGWDDHDRSGRTTALAIGANYLNSCAPNAILFTNGDNDTFPLWYAQEVEGIRTDVRVINLSLLNTDWYIDQMKRKIYDSEPVPFALDHDKYQGSTRNITYLEEVIKDPVDLREVFDILRTNESRLQVNTSYGLIDYLPSKKFRIAVDSARVIANGTVAPENAALIVKEVAWTYKGSYVSKNFLMVLDLLAHFNWERPIYFAITTGSDAYIGLDEHFQLEGLTYRLVPIRTPKKGAQTGRVETSVMYDNLMNKFDYDNIRNPKVYMDENNLRLTMNLRNNFSRLADALTREGKKDSAVKVLDYCMEMLPEKNVPFNYFVLPIAEAYYDAGATGKGNALMARLIDVFEQELSYYFSFTGAKAARYAIDREQDLALMQRIVQVVNKHKITDLAERSEKVFNFYFEMYSGQQ